MLVFEGLSLFLRHLSLRARPQFVIDVYFIADQHKESVLQIGLHICDPNSFKIPQARSAINIIKE